MNITRSHAQAITAMSIVTTIGDEVVEMVTDCVPTHGKEWMEFFFDVDTQGAGFGPNLTLTLQRMTDIHHSWGVAWYDEFGACHTAGSDLVYAERAQDILLAQLHADANEVVPADADPKVLTNVMIAADTPDDGYKSELVTCVPTEAWLILELHGILPSDEGWAIGWVTHEGVTVILGRDHDCAVDALSRLRGWRNNL